MQNSEFRMQIRHRGGGVVDAASHFAPMYGRMQRLHSAFCILN
jgi:hypothetical protein